MKKILLGFVGMLYCLQAEAKPFCYANVYRYVRQLEHHFIISFPLRKTKGNAVYNQWFQFKTQVSSQRGQLHLMITDRSENQTFETFGKWDEPIVLHVHPYVFEVQCDDPRFYGP